MKKIILILFSLTITLALVAQSPEKMSYQAVIRNSEKELVANKNVVIKIIILKGNEEVYKETHNKTTNANGLVTLKIGDGNQTYGNIGSIDWAMGSFYLKTETILPGNEEVTTEKRQLLSVPYALHAKTVENVVVSGHEAAFSDWDKDASDDFTGDYDDLTGKPIIPDPVDGSESAFNGWDKDASDDFSGDYDDLSGKPTIPDPVDGGESAFNGWDKDASDDFSGDYDDLENKPVIPEIRRYTGKTEADQIVTTINLKGGHYSVLSIEIKDKSINRYYGLGYNTISDISISYITEKSYGIPTGETTISVTYQASLRDCNLQVLYYKTGNGGFSIP